jgi:hypothetical protein
MIERSWRLSVQADVRQAQDRATLEAVERTLLSPK